MATTNLITKSLGNIVIQSGNGSPDHSAVSGSLYYNLDTTILWQNIDGSSSSYWMPLIPAIYGELQLIRNATTINATSTTGFFSTSGLTWQCYNNNKKGFTKNGGTLILNNGLTGTYRIIMHAGMIIPSTTAGFYDVGIAINGIVTNTPKYKSACGFNATKNAAHASVILDTTLNGGDNVSVAVGNASATGNFIVRDANLIIYRIDE